MTSQRKNWKPVVMVALLTPVVMAPLVLLGVYLGYYVGGQTGYSKSLLAIAFSTAGFVGSIFILFRIVGWVARRSLPARSRASSEPRTSP